ncbi:MAG: hypothetical protein HPY50_05135 [Firmicutes bacterium]|nr:hypothetical protein [Bacillota bacterium]
MSAVVNEICSQDIYSVWQKVSKIIWLQNSISTQMLEINYQLKELEGLLPEFKSTLSNLNPQITEKIKQILANNAGISEEFVTTWMRIRGLM